MGTVAPYFRYWGKALPARDAQAEPCHLLPYHSLDVAAVADVLLLRDTERCVRLAEALDLDAAAFRAFFSFSMALHDLGKFARSFQGQATVSGCDLVPPDPGKIYDGARRRHDALGAELWCEVLLPNHTLVEQADSMVALDIEDTVNLWLNCVFGHHGRPTGRLNSSLHNDFVAQDEQAACHFLEIAEALWEAPWPLELLRDEGWREQRLAPITWQLAGLATLADWLGSNAEFFPYRADPMPLTEYWERYAHAGASRVLEQTGLVKPRRAVTFPGFRGTFGFAPTPLQEWAATVPCDSGPQLFLLEDITGSGKTEAALTLAHRLLAIGEGRGLYFGLPTMATSNGMYRRLSGYYRALYPPDARPSLVLAHGSRHLEERFTASVVPEPRFDHDQAVGDPGAGAECRAWLADHRKVALLAEVGVGTIDQALLGVLPRRHQSLRLLGLADKVLVVDEIHAYDTYTTRLLQTLLRDHARQGGSAVLLSATLPQNLRQQLIGAWQEGRRREPGACLTTGFPLATQVHDHGIEEQEVAAWPKGRREVPVEFVHDEAVAVRVLLAAAREGRCGCWIRNTVGDAIRAFELVQSKLDEPERAILFHARFILADRQRIEDEALTVFGKASSAADRNGRILIATQVVEQSLDLDFDVLVSDLAPVDLLIQRAGRLHRHARDEFGNLQDEGPDQRGEPVLRVLAPEWSEHPDADWVCRTLPGTAAVYRNQAVLWRTAGVLRREGGICLPERARTLLETVYSDDAETPEGMLEADAEHWAGERVAAASARFNALNLEEGYGRTSDGAGWDDDQEIGTRFSNERTLAVVLVRQAEDGGMEPWHNHPRHPWALSTLHLRESLARRLPELPPEMDEAARALRKRCRELRDVRFWLAATEGESVRYDRDWGAVIPRRGGERDP